MVRNLPTNAGDAGDVGSIPGSGKSPVGGNSNPLVFLPGKFHGQRSLAGYSPWSCKELDTENACICAFVIGPSENTEDLLSIQTEFKQDCQTSAHIIAMILLFKSVMMPLKLIQKSALKILSKGLHTDISIKKEKI